MVSLLASGDLVALAAAGDTPRYACVIALHDDGTANVQLVETSVTERVPVATLTRINLGDRLHLAAVKNDTEAIVGLVNEAVARKINPGLFLNAVDPVGRTAAFVAAMKGHADMIKCLEHAQVDWNYATPSGVTPLYVAAEHGYAECVALLLSVERVERDRATHEGVTPLIVAATNGHAPCVKALLGAIGVDANRAIDTGETAAYLAAENGHSEVLRELQRASAQLDLPNEIGATAALVGAQNGHLDALRVLVDAGADVNVPLSVGDNDTAATIAAYGNATAVLHILVEGGANLEYCDATGHSAADYLRERHSVAARAVLQGSVDAVKDRGNAAFAAKRCRDAVALYTRAIELATARLLPPLTAPPAASNAKASAAAGAGAAAPTTARAEAAPAELRLRVRTIVGTEYAVSVPRSASVAALKAALHVAAKTSDWHPTKQRLLRRGGVALDDDSASLVSALGLEDGAVLFLVTRLAGADAATPATSPRARLEAEQLTQMEKLLEEHQALLDGVRAHEDRERDDSAARLSKRLAQKRERQAAREARYALERAVGMHVLYSNRAVANVFLKELADALRDANRAIAIRRDWCKGYLRKCSALKALKRYGDAVGELETALERCPAAEHAKLNARLASLKAVIAREHVKVVRAATSAAVNAATQATKAAKLALVTADAVVSMARKKEGAVRTTAAAKATEQLFGAGAAARVAAARGGGSAAGSARGASPSDLPPGYKIMAEDEYLDFQKTQRESEDKLEEAMKKDPRLRAHILKQRADWRKKQAKGMRPIDEMADLLEAFAKEKGMTLSPENVTLQPETEEILRSAQ